MNIGKWEEINGSLEEKGLTFLNKLNTKRDRDKINAKKNRDKTHLFRLKCATHSNMLLTKSTNGSEIERVCVTNTESLRITWYKYFFLRIIQDLNI